MRLAVIGTGIAGNAAAWLLSERHAVTVYERELQPGGHSHTVRVDYDGDLIDVDIGFIVFNEPNYPELTSLFEHLGVKTVETCMSFAMSADHGRFEWRGGGETFSQIASGLFAQPRNIISPAFFRMLAEVQRFNRQSVSDLRSGRLRDLSLGEYLRKEGFGARVFTDYLGPMGSAIWSSPSSDILSFPAENFISFFDNHRLLHLERPRWRTVQGGSRHYVEKLTSRFRNSIRLGCAVTSIDRTDRGVAIRDSHGHQSTYDAVVMACHSDQALAALSDADPSERSILGAIRYAPNTAYLHRDHNLMPKRRNAWASWNFLRWGREMPVQNDVSVTYWMNRLQGIDDRKPLFVSLNPPCAPAPHLTFGKFTFAHPQYDAAAFAAQRRLPEIQGSRRTWFCGAWTGYGFHEDGLRSGISVAEALGAVVPWRQSGSLAQAAE
ncbi:FAD-dependent oxidoreductase [Bradyrhizobium liaoningense]|uniref:NAD(P)/FAD-dependent oxidoreductase n=1 Tax=Bradyrhizobium liaoningense TaxID=43992 RepID=UPI001BAE1949|nr:FAD-dependent oxidoreductase [Bradyrhizobium liaoningense]MBR0740008.1 FAD-dependent oxidoreductase [Bradyrhizobium liaoningense]